MVKPKEISSSNENFLSVQGELCKSLSIPSVNSTGKTLKYPNGLNGSSTKSDTDSGISGDTYVGDIRIKQVSGIFLSPLKYRFLPFQVDIHADYELVQLLGWVIILEVNL